MGNNLSLPSNLDLMSAAVAEYDFIRAVDKRPLLYTTPFLLNALYRYETYWLPLVGQYEGEYIPAPLDIEWVWHCHILNPIAYSDDCKLLVGKVIDHKPMMLIESEREKSKRYWSSKYPGVSYDVDFTSPLPLLENFVQKCSCDIVATCQRQRCFNYNVSLPHFRDPKFLEEAIKRYKMMLIIKRGNPSTLAVPCCDNDLIWHAHQQFPLNYMSDTRSILGNVLERDDLIEERSSKPLHDTNPEEKAVALWRWKKEKFHVDGGIFRGVPPLPDIHSMAKHFNVLASREYKLTEVNLTLSGFNMSGDYNISLQKITTSGGREEICSEENIQIQANEDHRRRYKINAKVGELHTDNYMSVELTCQDSALGHVYRTSQPLSHVFIPVSPEKTLAEFQLESSTGPEVISASFNCICTEKITDFTFNITQIVRNMMKVNHINDVLHHVELMAPGAPSMVTVPCEYNDQVIQTSSGLRSFTFRVVHCPQPPLSAVEVFDLSGNVVSSVHTIGKSALPHESQVSGKTICFTYNPPATRAFLIRGETADWGIIHASWIGFVKDTQGKIGRLGNLMLKLLLLNGKDSRWIEIVQINPDKPTHYTWVIDDEHGFVDLEAASMQFSSTVNEIPEWIALGCAIALSFVLCQPKESPPAGGVNGAEIHPYLQPLDDSHGSLSLDSMTFLRGAGLYSTMLPRWYQAYYASDHFYKVYPNPEMDDNWAD